MLNSLISHSQIPEIFNSLCDGIKKVRTTFREPLCDFILFLSTLDNDCVNDVNDYVYKMTELSFITIDEAIEFTRKNISQENFEIYKDRFIIYWTFLKCIQSQNVYAKVCASQSQLPEIYNLIIKMVIKHKEGESKRKLCLEINMEYLKYVYRLDGEKYKKAHKNIKKLYK